MIEIKCVYGKGRNKKIRRRCIHGSDVLEIVETDDGKAIIRLARTEHKYRCWVETDESFDDVKAKVEEARKKRFCRE